MNYVLLSLFTLGLNESSCDQVKSPLLKGEKKNQLNKGECSKMDANNSRKNQNKECFVKILSHAKCLGV